MCFGGGGGGCCFGVGLVLSGWLVSFDVFVVVVVGGINYNLN